MNCTGLDKHSQEYIQMFNSQAFRKFFSRIEMYKDSVRYSYYKEE